MIVRKYSGWVWWEEDVWLRDGVLWSMVTKYPNERDNYLTVTFEVEDGR